MAVQQEPIRRFGVAEAIVLGGIFLASDGARFMPRSGNDVDGGLNLQHAAWGETSGSAPSTINWPQEQL